MLFDTYSPRSRVGVLFGIKMKRLSDLCLQCIGENLHSIVRSGRFLPIENKEVLLERLVNHDCLTEQRLPHITYNLFSEKLRRVNFYKSYQVTDTLLKQLAGSGCQIEWLTIHDCSNVTDAGILHITDKQTSLQCAELRKLTSLTKKGIAKLISPKLRKVDLRGCGHMDNEGVVTLTRNNPHINHLVLVRCAKVTDAVLPPVADNLAERLEVLDLADIRTVSDVGIQAVAEKCPNLKKLTIGGCNLVSDSGMGHLFARCQDLRSLNISYCGVVLANDQVLTNLPSCLMELSLCGVMMRDPGLFVNVLTRLSNVRMLSLCGVPALNDDSLTEVLSVIGHHVEELDLSGGITMAVTDKGLKAVTKYCTNLKVLGVSLLKGVSGLTLLPLLNDAERADKIQGLLMACKNIKSDVLDVVARNCHSLESLDLGGNGAVDDLFLTHLAENCHKLAYLNIKGCTQVSDAGVCELALHCPLGVIVLAGLRLVTDRSIITLANNCPHLEEIYMNGCYGISRAAIQYLVDLLLYLLSLSGQLYSPTRREFRLLVFQLMTFTKFDLVKVALATTYTMDSCFGRVHWTHKIPNADPDSLVARNLDTGEFGVVGGAHA